MTDVAALKNIWMKDPEFAGEHEALGEEVAVVHALVKARTAAGMIQERTDVY